MMLNAYAVERSVHGLFKIIIRMLNYCLIETSVHLEVILFA